MDKLILKILKEEFVTKFIEVVTYDFSKIKHFFSINEGKATAPVYHSDVEYIEKRIKKIYNQYDYISIGNHKIIIEPTTHWYQRLNRKMEPEYKNIPTIEDPELSEGIDLVEKYMDSIIYPYLKKINWGKTQRPCMELISNSSVMPDGTKTIYSIILKFELIGKQKYLIKLITQIKGERLYSEKYNCSKYTLNGNKKRMKVYYHPLNNQLSYDCYAY